MNRRRFLCSTLGAAAYPAVQRALSLRPATSKRVVLIGGKKSHGPGEHDFPNAIPLLASFLKRSSTFREVDVVALPEGFPADLSVLDGASSILLYFDGVQTPPEPLLQPARIAAMQKAMGAGAGLICLHQASTVPPGDTTIPLVDWLGAKRNGMFDRTTEQAHLQPGHNSPVSSGLTPFTYEDEFYPTLLGIDKSKRVTPILRAELHVQYRDGKTLELPEPGVYTVAWTYERPGGGRSFGFTGCHYLRSLEQPQVQKMLLNAICWTSGMHVPAEGITLRPG